MRLVFCISIAGLILARPVAGAVAVKPPVASLRTQADDLFASGKYPEATSAYERLERSAPQNREQTAYALFQQGLCKLKYGQPVVAASLWTRLRTFYPQSSWAATSLLLEADNSSRREQLYDEILQKYPTAPEAATVLLRRGQAAFERRDYQGAVIQWEQFLRVFPGHPSFQEISQKLQTARLAAAGNQEVAAALEIESFLKRADALFDHADFKEAAQLYGEIVRKYPGAPQTATAASRLARCQFALGKTAAAVETLWQQANTASGSSAKLLGEVVAQSAGLRPLDQVRIAATRLLLQRYPEAFETQQALFIGGLVAQLRRNHSEAGQWWQELLRRYPKTAFRTAVERMLKSPEHRTEDAAKKKPRKPTVAELAAKAERERRRVEAVTLPLETALRSPTAGVEARSQIACQLAHQYVAAGRYDAALQLYQWLWEQVPPSPLADQAVFGAAQVLLRMHAPQEATEHLTYLINRYPESNLRPLALFCLGNRRILYKGDLKGAWPYYEQLIRQYPNHPLAEQARKFWATVVKLSRAELQQQVADFVKQERKRQPT